jgi:hypothetical protein
MASQPTFNRNTYTIPQLTTVFMHYKPSYKKSITTHSSQGFKNQRLQGEWSGGARPAPSVTEAKHNLQGKSVGLR